MQRDYGPLGIGNLLTIVIITALVWIFLGRLAGLLMILLVVAMVITGWWQRIGRYWRPHEEPVGRINAHRRDLDL